MLYRNTCSISPAAASTSRGMAMSMMKSGRLRRGRIVASTRALVRIGAAAPVAVMTMSLAPRVASSSSQGAAEAPPMASAVRAACARVRLTIVTRLRTLRPHVLRGELAHFAGADDEHVPCR